MKTTPLICLVLLATNLSLAYADCEYTGLKCESPSNQRVYKETICRGSSPCKTIYSTSPTCDPKMGESFADACSNSDKSQ